MQHHNHNINGDTLCPGKAHGAMGLMVQRVADHDASVHRDAAQQVDADVHVGVVEEARYTAGDDPQPPVVVLKVVVNPQRDGKDEEHVREGQVQEEDTQDVLPPHLLPNGAKGQNIKDQAKDEGNDVNRHQEITNGAVANLNTRGVVSCGWLSDVHGCFRLASVSFFLKLPCKTNNKVRAVRRWKLRTLKHRSEVSLIHLFFFVVM